jgi:HTH-type transcriptional regulator/antitoxin MqsA
MRLERHDGVLVYRDHKKSIKTLGWWCADCDEAILDGKALAVRERAFLELKAEVDEVLGPQEVTQVREKLGLSQRAAGELLGGGPRAFQKYEAGKQSVSTPMSNLLRLLANDPTRLDELRDASKPRGSARAATTRRAATAPAKKRASGSR